MNEIPREVIIRAQQGDIGAFEQVYRAASGFIFTLALRITGNRQDAEEITQDVFLKIHRHLQGFAFRSSIKTWIYRIAVNTALNRYKRIARERSRKVDFDTVIETHGIEAPQEAVARDEENEANIKDALAGLNADQRAVLLMREVEGLRYEEIAQSLGINVNTVRTRLKRARDRILNHHPASPARAYSPGL